MDAQEDGKTALYLACAGKHIAVVKVLHDETAERYNNALTTQGDNAITRRDDIETVEASGHKNMTYPGKESLPRINTSRIRRRAKYITVKYLRKFRRLTPFKSREKLINKQMRREQKLELGEEVTRSSVRQDLHMVSEGVEDNFTEPSKHLQQEAPGTPSNATQVMQTNDRFVSLPATPRLAVRLG